MKGEGPMDELPAMYGYEDLFGGEDDAADKADPRQEREDLHCSDHLPAQERAEIPGAGDLEGMGKGPSEPGSSSSDVKGSGTDGSNLKLPALTHARDKHDIDQSMMCQVANTLRAIGVPPAFILPGLWIVCTAVSPHFKESWTVFFLKDDMGAAVDLVLTCTSLVPRRFQMPFTSLSPSTLYKGGEQLDGKTLICFDVKGLKKAQRELLLLMESGRAVNYQPSQTKGVGGLEEKRIEGHTSFILVGDNDEQKRFDRPHLIKVPLNNVKDAWRERMMYKVRAANDPLLLRKAQLGAGFLARRFERPGVEVEVLFADQLFQALGASAVIVLELCRVVANMEALPPLSEEEILYRFADVPFTPQGVPALRGASGMSSDVQGGRLQATKATYYYPYKMLEGRLNLGGEMLGDEESLVLEAVQKLNRDAVLGGTLVDKDDNVILDTLAIDGNERLWASWTKIIDAVNGKGPVRLSKTMPLKRWKVDENLKKLMGSKLIKSTKEPGSKNALVYAANTLEPVGAIALPHPRDIIDPVYEGRTITVVNPITGEPEDI